MRKCVLPLLLCAVLLCGCGGEKSLTVQDQYRTVVSADMEAEGWSAVRPAMTAPSP